LLIPKQNVANQSSLFTEGDAESKRSADAQLKVFLATREISSPGMMGKAGTVTIRRWEWQRVGDTFRALPTEESLRLEVALLTRLAMGQ
jgi:hypothetical protein